MLCLVEEEKWGVVPSSSKIKCYVGQVAYSLEVKGKLALIFYKKLFPIQHLN